jgi:LPXTG-motif cell wall-anchored protein
LIHCHEHRLETFMITKRFAAALAGAALVVLGGAGGAFASSYEPAFVHLTVTPTTLPGGESFTGTATSNKDCAWEITYAGPSGTAQPITGNGTSIDFAFETDPVDSQTTDAVKATCNYDPALRASAPLTDISQTVDVTLTPGGLEAPSTGGGLGGLPNTGGPSYWLAALGAVLTAIGAGAVIRSRRPARA